MKNFDQLTIDQKMAAYKFARETLETSVRENFVEFASAVPAEDLVLMAEEIAENATYSDDGKPCTDDMEVPYYFLGGCI